MVFGETSIANRKLVRDETSLADSVIHEKQSQIVSEGNRIEKGVLLNQNCA